MALTSSSFLHLNNKPFKRYWKRSPCKTRANYSELIIVSTLTISINIKPFLSWMIVKKKNYFLPKTQTIHQDLKTKINQIFVINM